MDTYSALSREDLERLISLAHKLPASTSWDYVLPNLKEGLKSFDLNAALWWPAPEGLEALSDNANEVFKPLVAHAQVEDVISQGETPIEDVTEGTLFPISANRQNFGALLLSGNTLEMRQQVARTILPMLGMVSLSNQLSEEVSKRTSTDKLTGLWNRMYFNERFREECERLVRSKETGAVTLIALDNFTAYARTIPQEEANALYEQVGQTVRQVIRQTDWAVRWDGYELLFYFPSTTAEAAVEVLKRFARKLVALNPILEPLAGVSSTVETTSPRALVQLATRRLDLARKDGGRRVICYAVPGGGLQFYRESEV